MYHIKAKHHNGSTSVFEVDCFKIYKPRESERLKSLELPNCKTPLLENRVHLPEDNVVLHVSEYRKHFHSIMIETESGRLLYAIYPPLKLADNSDAGQAYDIETNCLTRADKEDIKDEDILHVGDPDDDMARRVYDPRLQDKMLGNA